jgi:hypothetical protein
MTLIKSNAIANAEQRPINIGAFDVEYRLKSFSGIQERYSDGMAIKRVAAHRLIERESGAVGISMSNIDGWLDSTTSGAAP